MSNFKVLKGLPGDREVPQQFGYHTKTTHSEGFVVEFNLSQKESWIGNFQLGLTNYNAVRDFFYDNYKLVIAGGQAYIVNLNEKNMVLTCGGCIFDSLDISSRQLILLIENTDIIALNNSGIAWTSERLSTDGVRNIKIVGECVVGEGWNFDDTWIPFKVRLETGSK